MKYVLENVKLRKVAEGKQNAGSLFVQADVVNPDDLWDRGGQMTNFDEKIVNKFAEYLALAELGEPDQFGRQTFKASRLKDANKPLPEALTVLTNAKFQEYVFPNGPMVMLDSDGQPRRDKDGKPIVRSSVYVLTKEIIDNETGERTQARGYGLREQGDSIAQHLYAPLSEFNVTAPGVVMPQSVEQQPAPETPTQPATQPTAAAPAV